MNSKLSVFSVTLITICSVDSIRNLPVAALAGSHLFHYFTLALLFFLLPCAIVAIWFSSQSQQGVYGWVKQGLGQPFAFMAILFQCIQNVLLYPTLLIFIAGTFLYTLSPELVEHKSILFGIILVLIWGLTWVNLKGIQLSSRFNSFCTITGLFIPFCIILIMGLYWWLTQTTQTQDILPAATHYSWTSLTAIILSFCGIELAAVHANETQPGAFRKAVLISVFIIFLSMLFGSIILAMIIPAKQLSFVSCIPQLIQLFFTKMNCPNLVFIANILIVIGCLGTANNWLIAPIKGLGYAAGDGLLSLNLTKLNNNKAPANLLIIQAVCVTIISTMFFIIPSLNASYWIMVNAATQINILMYLLLFISAIKLVSREAIKSRLKIVIPSLFGIFGSSIALLVSFTPPPAFEFNSPLFYALSAGFLFLIIIIMPVWFNKKIPKVYTLVK